MLQFSEISWRVRMHLLQRCLIGLTLMFLMGCQRRDAGHNADETVVSPPSWQDRLGAIETGRTTELRYTTQPISADEVASLGQVAARLTVLEIDQTQIEVTQLVELFHRLSALRQLMLAGPVDNDMFANITKHLPTLRVLNLPAGQFDNSALDHLGKLDHLELLRISTPNIDDAGLQVVATFDSIRFLHLIDVPMTDAGLESIAEMENLQSFYLDGGKCTEEGLSELIKRRPRLHFHWNQLHLEDDPNSHAH